MARRVLDRSGARKDDLRGGRRARPARPDREAADGPGGAPAATVPIGTFVTDAHGALTLASERWCALAGLAAAEARGTGWLAALHPEDRERVGREWAEAVRRRRDYETHARFVRRDGDVVWVSASFVLLPGASGQPTGWVASFADTSAQRRVLDELTRQRAFLRQVIDVDPSFIFAKDREGRFTLVNKAVADAYGTTVEALVGRTDADFNPNQAEVAHFRRDDLQVMDTRREKLVPEEVITDASGRRRVLQTIKRPILGPDGSANQVLGVATDITARKALEEQLAHAQKMEAVGRLAGGIAHDFNNLLTIVLGSVQAMLERLGPGDELRASSERIRRAAERATMLTRQLVTFGRTQVLRPRLLDLDRVVAESVDLIRPLIGEEVDVLVSLDTPGARVRADPAQVTQVVLNLAINARDAMPGGGTLTIRTGTVTIDAARAAAEPGLVPGEYVTLAVGDTGTGIPAHVLPHVFEPFFTTKAPGQGTGLGLATTYGIVKQSGGHLAIATEPGLGTTVSVLLPRTHEADEPEAPPEPVRARGRETILLVEDEATVRAIASSGLREKGFRVLEAGSGAEALAAARAFADPIDLLVTDVVMPHMSGPDLAAQLRTMRPDTRVLYTSGCADPEVERRGEGEEAVAFLPKPYVPETLALRVREILDGREA